MKKQENKTTIQENTAPIAGETAESTNTQPSPYENMSAAELVDLLNATEDMNAHKPMLEALDEQLKKENKSRVAAAVSGFADMAADRPDDFWREFVQTPYAECVKLSVDSKAEAGEMYSLTTRNRRVLFTQIDKVYGDKNNGQTIANAKNYYRMIAHLTHNLYRATCNDLSEESKDTAVMITAKYHGKEDNETGERAVSFSGCSNNKMMEQLQAIVDTIMPASHSVRLRKADLNYIRIACRNAKEGMTKTMDEKTVEASIWVAVRQRTNGVAYEVKSTAKCHKEPKPKAERTEAQEEKTSRIPERPEAVETVSKVAKSGKTQVA